MKLRTDYVTNSSSSSYVIVAYTPEIDLDKIQEGLQRSYDSDQNQTFIIGPRFHGRTDFGWGPDNISDFESKMAFAYLTFKLSNLYDKPEKLLLLNTVLKEILSVQDIDWRMLDLQLEHGDAYIDHQSQDCGVEIFESACTLRRFLLHPNSCVVLDNDNH